MEAIHQWFENGCDFEEGINIYNSLPKTDRKVLRSLKKGKTSYNKSLLIKILRQELKQPTPVKAQKKTTHKATPKPLTPTTDATIAKQHQEQHLKNDGLKREYGQTKYAHLPAELRPRYKELGTIFYQMCELKFILNDLPAKAEKEALQIILQIEELDDQRTMIWKEIDHWNTHKTLLPTSAEDYSKLNSDELRTKKARIASNVTKLEQRINAKYATLFEETDRQKTRTLENSIRRSEERLHQHKLNILKINELL